MPTVESAPPKAPRAATVWPWLALGLSVVWVVMVRVPLVVNADQHLDSDLAVDGLTLLDATQGRWRWHYPGTPHIGSLPVALSFPQAVIWGTNASTLVSGGTLAYVGLVVATFLLTRRAFGPTAAVFSLVPLTFASTGMVWLSGRITGGHLAASVWHAGAFALLAGTLQGTDGRRPLLLGLWCGLGLWVDSMFLLTLAGLVPVALAAWATIGPRRVVSAAALAGLGLSLGIAPKVVGSRVDPYDAYREQFGLVTQVEVLLGHTDLLVRECLPRLVAGHRFPGFESDPSPRAISSPPGYRPREPIEALAVAATAAGIGCWLLSNAALLSLPAFGRERPGRLVASGLILSGLAAVGGFVSNQNIFNSDNYRYLVTLLVPYAVGFGLAAEWLVGRGRKGQFLASLVVLGFGVAMSADLSRWYARFGWVEGGVRLARPVSSDTALTWLREDPSIRWVEGGYWDVYRVCFLTGGRVHGTPYPIYPNRFPDWKPERGTRRAVLARKTPEGAPFMNEALAAGGTLEAQARGLSLIVMPDVARAGPVRP